MNTIQSLSIPMLDFSYTQLLHEHNLLLISGIVVLFISIVLRSMKTAAAELVLLLLLFASTEVFSNPLYVLLAVLQTVLALWVLWKVKNEIDITYYRQCEKTLKRPRDITSGGNAGTHRLLF